MPINRPSLPVRIATDMAQPQRLGTRYPALVHVRPRFHCQPQGIGPLVARRRPHRTPCPQTTGTTRAGMARWNAWVRNRSGLKEYGRRRNDMRQPHAPSRMSCYLNLGIVSIFRLVQEVKAAQAQKIGGADKYEEEIFKWREMAYAFCFSRTDYCGAGAVPNWAQRSLDQQMRNGGGMEGGG